MRMSNNSAYLVIRKWSGISALICAIVSFVNKPRENEVDNYLMYKHQACVTGGKFRKLFGPEKLCNVQNVYNKDWLFCWFWQLSNNSLRLLHKLSWFAGQKLQHHWLETSFYKQFWEMHARSLLVHGALITLLTHWVNLFPSLFSFRTLRGSQIPKRFMESSIRLRFWQTDYNESPISDHPLVSDPLSWFQRWSLMIMTNSINDS